VELRERAASWQRKAEELRPYSDAAATAFETCAAELERDLSEQEEALLSPAAAAEWSGYSERHLRSLVEEEKLPNHGRRGKPLYRRSDLPRKPARPPAPAGYDPEADARATFAKQRGSPLRHEG